MRPFVRWLRDLARPEDAVHRGRVDVLYRVTEGLARACEPQLNEKAKNKIKPSQQSLGLQQTRKGNPQDLGVQMLRLNVPLREDNAADYERVPTVFDLIRRGRNRPQANAAENVRPRGHVH